MRRERNAKPIVEARSILLKDLFDGRAYHIDAFQRSYAWGLSEVAQLVNDLSVAFLSQWKDTDHHTDVQYYDPYFLGPIIVYRENRRIYLADGQQRVTTLLLLLIQLYRLASRRDDIDDLKNQLGVLIKGEDAFRRSFAVSAERLEPLLDDLRADRLIGLDAAPPDIARVGEAAEHILACFPVEIRTDALPFFGLWLLHRVSLVEMDAGDGIRGRDLFDKMNDRGLRLAPLDLLKNYLLRDAREDPDKLDRKWRSMITALEMKDRNVPIEFVRTVLHAQYFDADVVEEHPGPRESPPHEWLARNEKKIELTGGKGARVALLTEQLEPLHGRYLELMQAAGEYHSDLETIWFNGHNGLTRQFDLTLAAVRRDDSDPVFRAKARLVANFVDLFVVTRGLDGVPYGPSDLAKVVDPLLSHVRNVRTTEALGRVLGKAAAGWYQHFDEVPSLRYRSSGGRSFLRYFLARLTAWLDRETGRHESVERMLARRDGRWLYEIEHLFTAKPGVHDTETPAEAEYGKLRNRVGGLVLLSGDENASLGGASLTDKVNNYVRFNWLAASVHPGSYRPPGNVAFRKFVDDSAWKDKFLPYQAGDSVEKYIDARADLYRAIATRIWSPARLELTLPSSEDASVVAPRPGWIRAGSSGRVSIADLLGGGLLAPGDRLVGYKKGGEYWATVLSDGRIRTASGAAFKAPTSAEADARGASSNGWHFWEHERTRQKLDALRQRFVNPA